MYVQKSLRLDVLAVMSMRTPSWIPDRHLDCGECGCSVDNIDAIWMSVGLRTSWKMWSRVRISLGVTLCRGSVHMNPRIITIISCDYFGRDPVAGLVGTNGMEK